MPRRSSGTIALTATLLVLAAIAVFAFAVRPASTPVGSDKEQAVTSAGREPGGAEGQELGTSPSPSPTPSSTATPKPSPRPTPMMTAASKRAARRVGIPILVYHHISSPSGSSPFLHVSPAAFAQQMCWLHGRGYHAVTLRQVFDFWAYNEPIPRKPIVITFDDGWRTVYTAAAPVLKRYAWPGVINEVVWAIDANYGMTKGQLLRLIKRGWEINSHTVSHAMLTQVPQSKLTEELESSRYRLSHNLHTTVDFLCYPGGLYDSTVIRAVRAAGYKGALSIWGGLARWKERWTLRRITATESGFQIPSQ